MLKHLIQALLVTALVPLVPLVPFVPASFVPAILSASAARTVGGDHPAGPVDNEHWPAGLAAIVNAPDRVHGWFVNWEDVFYFRGDTQDLHRFIRRAVALPGCDLRVVLHPGPLDVRSPWDAAPRPLRADWTLYAAPFTREQVTDDGITPGPFMLRIHVYLGGRVRLDGLAVPAEVTVESSGEIEDFVRRHAERR